MDQDVKIIVGPKPVVTREEAKLHLVVENDEDDALIDTFLAAATAWLDGPTGWLGRAIGVQVLEWQSDSWPCYGEALPYPPVIEVISVRYIDPDGVEHDWPFPTPLYWDDLPSLRGRPGDLKIRYRAGYGRLTEGENPQWENFGVPEPIRVAVMMLVAQWYQTRASVLIGGPPETMPFAVNALLQPYRIYR